MIPPGTWLISGQIRRLKTLPLFNTLHFTGLIDR